MHGSHLLALHCSRENVQKLQFKNEESSVIEAPSRAINNTYTKGIVGCAMDAIERGTRGGPVVETSHHFQRRDNCIDVFNELIVFRWHVGL
jgi:hypothetical protein